MTRIWVRWIDARAEVNIIPKEVAKEIRPLYRENVGFLVDTTQEYLILAFGIVNNDDGSLHSYDTVLTIPSRMILETNET